MHIKPGNAQHIGRRTSQQDAFGFTDIHNIKQSRRFGSLCVLADGMGGHAFGEAAAKTAVATALDLYSSSVTGSSLSEALDRIVTDADRAVVEMARQRGEHGNVGTTMLVLAIQDESMYWRSVGDSRIYLWRAPYLCQMNSEHTYGNQLDHQVKNGEISQAYADQQGQREAITSYVGQGPVSEVDGNLKPFRLIDGDFLLLCSDGLFKSIDESTIIQVLKQASGPQEAADNLLAKTLAADNPSQDNVTILVIECTTNPPTRQHATSFWRRIFKAFKPRSKRATR
ncbi:MAG: serine/threonine-protein phosphatase [Gammaproteobacteria bacterium]|nr:serine/threonine-protein phosphatase [Gammaproteobacteria bacterium]